MSESYLLGRLRKRLGLSGLSVLAMASGPCGGCPPDIQPYDECVLLENLLRWREQALSWTFNEEGFLVCAENGQEGDIAGAGGVGGLMSGPTCTAYADSGDEVYWGDLEYIQGAAEAWDPLLGCPSPGQYRTLQILNSGDDYPFEAGSLSAIEGDPGHCCYHATGGPAHCPGGRPFLVLGRARVACVEASSAKGRSLEEAIGHAWLRDAQSEHASIAAFARLSLQLMHLGAPLHLVVESQQASLDEARHTEFCLEQSTSYLGPLPELRRIDMRDALSELSLRELLVSNIIEGCIGETLAAARARAQSIVTKDEGLARSLRKLSVDEERHAALAWKILGWLLEVGCSDFYEVAKATFVAHAPRSALGTEASEESTNRMHAGGRLSPSESLACDRDTWENTILPLAMEMFMGSSIAA